MITPISFSPDRFTFQLENGSITREEYLQQVDSYRNKFNNPSNTKHNLEYDLLTTNWILEKVRKSEVYAQNLYAALCNNDFIKQEMWPILKNQTWHCSWRYAGGIIANMRQEGDYIDWYCSGIRDNYNVVSENETSLSQNSGDKNHDTCSKYVPEMTVTEEIEQDLKTLGWAVVNSTD